WAIFVLSLIIYVMTLEPTMSLWDCGEFLVSAYKLEISHAPGAPLFMLLGRVFSLLSFGHRDLVAFMVNLISAISSAATVMFLFWISVWLMQKISPKEKVAVLLASAVGALAFAFTDSFWFSAVEAEVYALSSLFMALVLWAVTRWERESGQSSANRWIVLIFFFTGLSIGVHLLNLLVLPSVALITYFKKYKPSLKGLLLVLAGSGAFIVILMKVFIPGVFSLAGPFELFAVNRLELPVNSGFYFYILLLAVLLVIGLLYSHRKHKTSLNLALLCLLFLMLGYTSYFASFIRSQANPPVDQGNPETTFELIDYLNRESYGSRPILYGENYGSVPKLYEERVSYEYDGKRYFPTRLNPRVSYEEGTTCFFPRLNSKDPEHLQAYKRWVSMKGKKVSYRAADEQRKQTTIPTFGENLMYFLRYQFGHMYLRYFMWNFVGRQNDIQGYGGPENGNWSSGISLVDQARLGDRKNLPDVLKQNRGHNSYYFLPLLLGLVGLFFHYRKEKQTFLGMVVLFGLTSIGLVVYLNEIPITPRERDYVYVGSFFVFSLWIGLGALALFGFLQSKMKQRPALLLTGLLALATAPGILLQQNYGDHDRSGRYSARDIARNYLMCCEPNAILFTHADNDTYPLWYCQEVEGIRQDVRVVVMPYLSAGWYMEQIHHKIYENEGVRLSIPVEKYALGDMDYLPVIPRLKREPNVRQVLDFVANDSSQTKVQLRNGGSVNFIPVSKMNLRIGDQKIPVTLKKNYLYRNELAFWDILASNSNHRPICFTSLIDPKQYGLQNYLRCDGLVYTLVPEFHKSESVIDTGSVDVRKMYTNLIERCNWENLEDSTVYFNWHHRRLFASAQIRPAFYRLAKALTENHENEKVLQVIHEAEQVMPSHNWPVDYHSVLLCGLYFQLNERAAGEQRLALLEHKFGQWINYYLELGNQTGSDFSQELGMKMYLFQQLALMARQNKLDNAQRMQQQLEQYMKRMQGG
ncbi:MAG TPA: DUF2723 domain-containing protein, partial [Sunxiuqinia sp.]|nr:DUF2723 domain-containing protein [Sunxiuqinia sp.]